MVNVQDNVTGTVQLQWQEFICVSILDFIQIQTMNNYMNVSACLAGQGFLWIQF